MLRAPELLPILAVEFGAQKKGRAPQPGPLPKYYMARMKETYLYSPCCHGNDVAASPRPGRAARSATELRANSGSDWDSRCGEEQSAGANLPQLHSCSARPEDRRGAPR